MNADWLIVGGGVGGLTLAVKLAQHSLSFLVYEKQESDANAGAGLLLAPNATRILRKLGLLNEAFNIGHATSRWYILNQSGAILREIRINTEGLPALSIHRADLLALLRARLPVNTLKTGVGAQFIQTSSNSVKLSLTDESIAWGKALIGADGIRSAVRQHLFGNQPLQYRGYVGWRGIAPFVPERYQGGVLSETWGTGGRFGIAPIDARRTYWYASANRKESSIDPASDRQTNLLKHFGSWHQPVADLIAATPNVEILVSRIYEAPRLSAWSKGNITLLGDAAHAITPNLGQGACLAMEDAWILGSLLRNRLHPKTVFEQYQNARIRRARSIGRQSQAMGWIVQTENSLGIAIRNWVTPRIPDFLLHFGMRSTFAEQVI